MGIELPYPKLECLWLEFHLIVFFSILIFLVFLVSLYNFVFFFNFKLWTWQHNTNYNEIYSETNSLETLSVNTLIVSYAECCILVCNNECGITTPTPMIWIPLNVSSLPCVSFSGSYVFDIMDTYGGGLGVLWLAIFETIALMWIYGVQGPLLDKTFCGCELRLFIIS